MFKASLSPCRSAPAPFGLAAVSRADGHGSLNRHDATGSVATTAQLTVPFFAAALACASTPRRTGRRPPVQSVLVVRRAVDMPVKDAPVETTVAIPGAKVDEETREKRASEYRLLLFNDPMNKREFVAKCLMVICLLKEGDAYQVMMKAHREGVGVVGTYNYEKAEAYCEGLKAKGLMVDIIPCDDDDPIAM